MSAETDYKTPLRLHLVRVSPCCRMIWLYALQHKIPCELTDVNVFNGEHREPKFVAMNPHEEVPILTDGSTTVFGGIAILRYFAQKYTDFAGWGKTSEDRYRVHSVLDWASSKLLDVLGYKYVYPQLLERYHLPNEAATEELVDKGLSEASELLEALENYYLGDNPFLCGSELTVADSYVATILCQAEWVDFDFKLWPRLWEWLTRVKGQEHWREVHSTHDEFLQKLKKDHSIESDSS